MFRINFDFGTVLGKKGKFSKKDRFQKVNIEEKKFIIYFVIVGLDKFRYRKDTLSFMIFWFIYCVLMILPHFLPF